MGFRIGDKVRAKPACSRRYSDYTQKVYIVQAGRIGSDTGKPVVFSDDGYGGWINENMGLNELFESASVISLGGE